MEHVRRQAAAASSLQEELRATQARCQEQAATLAQQEAMRATLLQGVKTRLSALRGGAHEGWHDVYRLVRERASLLESGAYSVQESGLVRQLETAVLSTLERLVATVECPQAL